MHSHSGHAGQYSTFLCIQSFLDKFNVFINFREEKVSIGYQLGSLTHQKINQRKL